MHLVCVAASISVLGLGLRHLAVPSLLLRLGGVSALIVGVVCTLLLLWCGIALLRVTLLWLSIASLGSALLLCRIRVIAVAVVTSSVASVPTGLLGLSLHESIQVSEW